MNRRIFLTIVMSAACLGGSFPVGPQTARAQVGAPPSRIYWAQSPQRAMALARHSRLPILAFVTSEGCGYCRKMESTVWSHPQIISQVEAGFVPLKLVASQHRQLIASLGIRAYPTTILFTPEGKVIHRAQGYMPPLQVARLLRAARPAHLAGKSLPPVE